jgi:hypothetical protein
MINNQIKMDGHNRALRNKLLEVEFRIIFGVTDTKASSMRNLKSASEFMVADKYVRFQMSTYRKKSSGFKSRDLAGQRWSPLIQSNAVDTGRRS